MSNLQSQISFSLTAAQLLNIPFDGCIYLINYAREQGQITPEFLHTCYDAESAGKARWPVLNHLRTLLNHPPKA